MARIFRFSGYYVDVDRVPYSEKKFCISFERNH